MLGEVGVLVLDGRCLHGLLKASIWHKHPSRHRQSTPHDHLTQPRSQPVPRLAAWLYPRPYSAEAVPPLAETCNDLEGKGLVRNRLRKREKEIPVVYQSQWQLEAVSSAIVLGELEGGGLDSRQPILQRQSVIFDSPHNQFRPPRLRFRRLYTYPRNYLSSILSFISLFFNSERYKLFSNLSLWQ